MLLTLDATIGGAAITGSKDLVLPDQPDIVFKGAHEVLRAEYRRSKTETGTGTTSNTELREFEVTIPLFSWTIEMS